MTFILALGIHLSAVGVPANPQSAIPNPQLNAWLDRTMKLESRGDPRAVGDSGRSRGPYQIQRNIWNHYSSLAWRSSAHDPVASRRVARLILADCAKACRRDRRPVTFANARHYYRHGGF